MRMSRWPTVRLCLLLTGLVLASAPTVAAGASYQAFTTPFTPQWNGISSLAVGADGATWAVSRYIDSIRRISGGTTERLDLPFGTASGHVVAFGSAIALSRWIGGAATVTSAGITADLGTEPRQASGMAIAPDGSVWVGGSGKLVRYAAGTGAATEFALSAAFGDERQVMNVAVGGDGGVWFTAGYDVDTTKLGRVAPDGTVSLVLSGAGLIGGQSFGPDFERQALAATAAGDAWFRMDDVGGGTPGVRRVTPAGITSDIATPGADGSVVTGSDGAVYALGPDHLARIDSAGSVTSLSIPSADAPGTNSGFAADAAGALVWVGDDQASIVQRSSAGVFTKTPVASGTADLPTGVAVATDGSAWVADRGSGQITRLTTDGSSQTYSAGLTGSPSFIQADPDGSLWAIETGGKLAHISSAGSITEMSVPLAGSASLQDLAVDSAGTVWIADEGNHTIDRLPHGGALAAIPTGNSAGPKGLAVSGSDVWFTEPATMTIGHRDASGTITRFELPAASGSGSDTPEWIAAGSDDVFVGDTDSYEIVQLSTTGVVRQRMGSGRSGRMSLAADGRLWLNEGCGSLLFLNPGQTYFNYADLLTSGGYCDSKADVTVAPDGAAWMTAGPSGRVVRYVPNAIPPPDTTPPSVGIATPTEGQHFALNQDVPAVFSCNDDVAVDSCDGPVRIDTSSAGPHTYTVNASDNSGNSTTQSVGYVVDASSGSGSTPQTTSTPTSTVSAPPAGLTPTPPAPAAQTAAAATITAALRRVVPKSLIQIPASGVFRTSFAAPGPGTLTIRWSITASGAKARSSRSVIVASTKQTFSAAGKRPIALRLTTAAKKLLARTKRLRVVSTVSFQPHGGKAVLIRRTVTLKAAKKRGR